MLTAQTTSALFVAWQDPESRRYFPVARLVSHLDTTENCYEFAYIEGAQKAAEKGFQPFRSFPDLNTVYHDSELFTFFSNRLMSRKRPDFNEHVKQLGLDPESACDMDILVRSGGVRTTDSIELFPLPVFQEVEGGTCYKTFFLMHGFRHLKPESQNRILSLQFGDTLRLAHEVDNPVDSKALVLLPNGDIDHVGYVPHYLLSDVLKLEEKCPEIKITVAQVNPPPASQQQRLLCEMVSCWPTGFQPLSRSTYNPISDQATNITSHSP